MQHNVVVGAAWGRVSVDVVEEWEFVRAGWFELGNQLEIYFLPDPPPCTALEYSSVTVVCGARAPC